MYILLFISTNQESSMSRNIQDIENTSLDKYFLSLLVHVLGCINLKAFPLLFSCKHFIPYHDNENTNFCCSFLYLFAVHFWEILYPV